MKKKKTYYQVRGGKLDESHRPRIGYFTDPAKAINEHIYYLTQEISDLKWEKKVWLSRLAKLTGDKK